MMEQYVGDNKNLARWTGIVTETEPQQYMGQVLAIIKLHMEAATQRRKLLERVCDYINDIPDYLTGRAEQEAARIISEAQAFAEKKEQEKIKVMKKIEGLEKEMAALQAETRSLLAKAAGIHQGKRSRTAKENSNIEKLSFLRHLWS
ncbi:hypothetical protein [Propionispora vibrioides]|nr:hypothetical protein [Propionispora vibrioides]